MQNRTHWTITVIAAVAALAFTGSAAAMWPVAPTDQPHPIRGGFLEPRGHGMLHNGVDVGVDETRPEAGAPPGTSHAVYAMEAGTVYMVSASGVRIGRWGYGHVLATVAPGAQVARGDQIGWVLMDQWEGWHVHLQELDPSASLPAAWATKASRHAANLNPMREGGTLGPFAPDTAAPIISALRIRQGGHAARATVSGSLDFQVRVADPMPALWPAELAFLETEIPPYELAVEILDSHGRIVKARSHSYDRLPRMAIRAFKVRGSQRSLPASPCYAAQPTDCGRVMGFHLFGRRGSTLVDTASLGTGAFTLRVTATDYQGNAAAAERVFKVAP